MKLIAMRAVVCCSVMAAGMAGATFAGAQTGSDTTAQDKAFVAKSAEGSMAEIEMSKLALKKSKNDEVKTFAQKMVDDHTMLISNMKPFADQMGVQPPTKLNKAHMDEMARLRAMSGDKFDKEYVTAMLGDHHKDLGEFQTEASTTSNADLKSTVQAGTQVIKQHTEMIDQMAQKDGMTPPPMSSM